MTTTARFWLALSATLLPAFAAVDGAVINRTTGKPQANVVVTLVQPTQTGMDNLGKVKTDAAGKFHFDKDAAGGPQLLQAEFSGVTYTKMIPPGTAPASVEVDVFDASTDAKIATSAEDFVLFQPHDQQMTVAEVILIDNSSTTTYSDAKKGAVSFYLPPEAQGKVTVNATGPGGMPVTRPAEKTAEAGIYRVNYPIRPGKTRFDVSYSVPVTAPMVMSGKILNTGATGLVVPPGISLKGEDVHKVGVDPQGKFVFYGLKGKEYKVEIEGSVAEQAPAEGNAEDDSGQPRIEEIEPPLYQKRLLGQPVLLWIVEIALAILGLGFVLLYRSEKPQLAEADGAGRAPQASPRKGAAGR
jgi:hypothetical protein